MTTSNLESPMTQAYTSVPDASMTECGSVGAPFFMNELDSPKPSLSLNSPNLYSPAETDALATSASLELSPSAPAEAGNNFNAEPVEQPEPAHTSTIRPSYKPDPCTFTLAGETSSNTYEVADAACAAEDFAVTVSNAGDCADALCLDKAECVGDVADASNLVVKVFNKNALNKAEAAGFSVEEIASAYAEDVHTMAKVEAAARANANAMTSECVATATKNSSSSKSSDFIMPSGVNVKLLKAVAPKLDWNKLKSNLSRTVSSKDVVDSIYADESDEQSDDCIKMIELWERNLDKPISKTIKGAAAMVQRVFERLNYIKNAAIRNIIFNNINIPKDLTLFNDFNCNVIGYDNSADPYIESDEAITNLHANGNCTSKLCVLSLSEDSDMDPWDDAGSAYCAATAEAAASIDTSAANASSDEVKVGSGAAGKIANGKKCGSKVNNFTMYMDLAKGVVTTSETNAGDEAPSSLVSLVAPARGVMQRVQVSKLKNAISGLRALAIANSLDEEANPSDAISLYARDSVLHPLMQALSEQSYCDEAFDNGRYFHESGKTSYLNHHFDKYAFFKKSEVSAISERAQSITDEYKDSSSSHSGGMGGCVGARERYNKAMMQIFSDAGYRFMTPELIADLFKTLMAFDAAQRRLHRYVPFELITNASVASLPIDHVVVNKIRQFMRIMGLYRLIFDYSQDNEWSSILQDSFDLFKEYAAQQILTDGNCRDLLETLRINQSEHDLKRSKNVRRFFISPELLDNDATMLYDHRIHHFIPSRVCKVHNFLAIVAYINERARFSNKAHVETMPLLQMLEHPENTEASA